MGQQIAGAYMLAYEQVASHLLHIGIEAEWVQHDHRLAARHVRATGRSAGFFTIGLALAVLAAGSAFAASTGALKATDSTSAPAPSAADAERTQPGDHAQADGTRNIVVSEAPARLRSDARSAAKPQQ
jgi:hypothetical protein